MEVHIEAIKPASALGRNALGRRPTAEAIFAAGDVTNVFSEQVLISVGEGAKAALAAYEYLLEHAEWSHAPLFRRGFRPSRRERGSCASPLPS